MKTILVVDDEPAICAAVRRALRSLLSDVEVITASYGGEAMELLSSKPVNLVVTDLMMPRVDGFELLAHMSRHHPQTPVIVLTAHSGASLLEQAQSLGACHFMNKPFVNEELANRVVETLSAAASGYIEGITLTTLLQMVEMEKKTCTLRAVLEDHEGFLYFLGGKLINARSGEKTGEAAVHEIVSWGQPEISIAPSCKERRQEIVRSLNHVLMEGLRLEDERERSAQGRTGRRLQASASRERPGDLSSLFRSLHEVKGYRAAGVMDVAGNVLCGDSVDPAFDLPSLAATYHCLVRGAHAAAELTELEHPLELTLASPKGLVILGCVGAETEHHLHLLGFLAPGGNPSLLRMRLDRLAPKVLEHLAP
ncbi:MAG: response regulator, partial [Deltaproteobacteria bacterium]|nr:response regulator [Deltaproteobacteria bacterium]